MCDPCPPCSLDTLQQTKARLEISSQTTKQQHQKELEARDEEVEQIKNAMNKKVSTHLVSHISNCPSC